LWYDALEPFGKALEGLKEDFLALFLNGLGMAVVKAFRCHHGDTGMMVVLVVPVKEKPTERRGIFDGTESTRKLRAVFQCLELRF